MVNATLLPYWLDLTKMVWVPPDACGYLADAEQVGAVAGFVLGFGLGFRVGEALVIGEGG